MFYDLNCKINPQKPFAQKELVKSSIEGNSFSPILLKSTSKMVIVALLLIMNFQDL